MRQVAPIVALALMLLPACSRRSAPTDPPAPTPPAMKVNAAPSADLVAQGASVYEQSCALCHFDGSGSPTAPPLKGSPVVAESAKAVILTILKGQQGKAIVNGKPFNGLMPAQATMTDDEIAAVVTFVRKQYGGIDEAVQPADVAALR